MEAKQIIKNLTTMVGKHNISMLKENNIMGVFFTKDRKYAVVSTPYIAAEIYSQKGFENVENDCYNLNTNIWIDNPSTVAIEETIRKTNHELDNNNDVVIHVDLNTFYETIKRLDSIFNLKYILSFNQQDKTMTVSIQTNKYVRKMESIYREPDKNKILLKEIKGQCPWLVERIYAIKEKVFSANITIEWQSLKENINDVCLDGPLIKSALELIKTNHDSFAATISLKNENTPLISIFAENENLTTNIVINNGFKN